ncbi:MAG: hypothetical protein KC457_12145 [Myxococcales bacterium]|nr:hypothetical protein [Myxococcales bacterium]
MRLHLKTTTTALPAAVVVFLSLACSDPVVIGEGQFSRPITLSSDSQAPLPRLAWSPGSACPGAEGGCTSFCAGPPGSCGDACMSLLIDSGTPLSILPSANGDWSLSRECVEMRAAGGLVDGEAGALEASTAAFRFLEAPVVRAPGDDAGSWLWMAGDDRTPAAVGGVIGGNILRDFATEFRHANPGETPTVAFFSSYPGSEEVLADQGRAYLRLQYPGRLLGRLLNDHCEIGDGLDCELSRFSLTDNQQILIFESTRALLDACVAPPPCAVAWNQSGNRCQLSRGDALAACEGEDLGAGATLLVATGVPGLVLFSDSAAVLFGDVDALPDCAATLPTTTRACREIGVEGSLDLPGWPTITSLPRIKVRSLGLLEGLSQPSGRAPCSRLRRRLLGVEHQCSGYLAEERPVRPSADPFESVTDSALIIGEVSWSDDQLEPDGARWIDTLVVPATSPPVISLRREVTPEGAQPDGMIGGALLKQSETVLDFTESSASPGVRVRCLDPGEECLAVPACSADVDSVDFEGARAGRTSCCHGLPADLMAEVIVGGAGKAAPRIEDACCSAMPRASLIDLKSLGLCE